MTTLIIYLILTADHRWQFLAIERGGPPGYCSVLSAEVRSMFADKPGNIRVICTTGEEIEI